MMRHRTRNLLVASLALLLGVLPLCAQQAQAAPSVDLDALAAYIEKARQDWQVPGLAVAIVHDGKVVLARGFGSKTVGGAEPVDGDTLFAIASNTKAFTAAAIARLVDQGRLGWDDRVIDYLPYFRLYAPYVTEDMRIRDLLCHRTGLRTFSGDLLINGTTYSAEEVMRRARYLKPTGQFRADYGYSNLMFVTAGEVVRAVTGKPWEEFMQAEYLTPLGMERTLPNVTGLGSRSNLATPHTEIDGEIRAVPWHKWTSAASAGGIISSARDLSRWLLLQLSRGTLDGREYFSERSSRTMWTPHISRTVSAGSERLTPSTHFRAYGLGWGLHDYLGRKIVSHGGALDGMFSQTVLVPEENLGMVVLTNSTTSITNAVTARILDAYLGGEPRDWSAVYAGFEQQGRERNRRRWQQRIDARVEGTRPSYPLDRYAATYGGPMYGDATVTLEDGKLVLRLLPSPDLVADLTHWHYDTFEIHWRKPSPWYSHGLVQFLLDPQGRVVEFVLDVPNDDFWFDEPEFKRKD